MVQHFIPSKRSQFASTISVLIALAMTGCVSETQSGYKVVESRKSSPRSSSESSVDPGSEGSPGSAAFTMMDRSGYLQCTIAVRAAAEADVSPDLQHDITRFFSQYQTQVRPLIDAARKNPRTLDKLIADSNAISTSKADELHRLMSHPQYPVFAHQVKVVQNELNLLTTQPLLFQQGFDTLHLTPNQRGKIEPLLQEANKRLQNQQTSAFSGANLADLAEQTMTTGLKTRDAIRSNMTPEQTKAWDALAAPVPATQPA